MLFNSQHPFISTCADVNEIISPLNKMGINYFSYKRCNKDGSRFYLTSNTELMDYYLNERQCHTFAHTESYQEGNKVRIALWSTINQFDLYKEMSDRFDVDHGIYLIIPNDGFYELFGFATSKLNYSILNQYFSNLDRLFNFIDYFKERAERLINESEKEKIICNIQEVQIGNEFDMGLLTRNKINPGIKLPRRQSECAKQLLLGKTTPQIASSLQLSPRTIEFYINNLKVKLDCQNKSELLIKLINAFNA